MTRARRGNAVLAHSCANLKGHFARNGDNRALKAFRGKGNLGRESGGAAYILLGGTAWGLG